MRVFGTGKNAKLGQHRARKAVFRQHALDRVHDDKLRIADALLGKFAKGFAADVTGEKHVPILLLFFTGDDDFLGVDDDNVIARINMRGVGGLVAATDEVGGFNRETAKHLALGIDEIPFGLDRALVGEKGFHAKKRGR